jgi:hypothetical protein
VIRSNKKFERNAFRRHGEERSDLPSDKDLKDEAIQTLLPDRHGRWRALAMTTTGGRPPVSCAGVGPVDAN